MTYFPGSKRNTNMWLIQGNCEPGWFTKFAQIRHCIQRRSLWNDHYFIKYPPSAG